MPPSWSHGFQPLGQEMNKAGRWKTTPRPNAGGVAADSQYGVRSNPGSLAPFRHQPRQGLQPACPSWIRGEVDDSGLVRDPAPS